MPCPLKAIIQDLNDWNINLDLKENFSNSIEDIVKEFCWKNFFESRKYDYSNENWIWMAKNYLIERT